MEHYNDPAKHMYITGDTIHDTMHDTRGDTIHDTVHDTIGDITYDITRNTANVTHFGILLVNVVSWAVSR